MTCPSVRHIVHLAVLACLAGNVVAQTGAPASAPTVSAPMPSGTLATITVTTPTPVDPAVAVEPLPRAPQYNVDTSLGQGLRKLWSSHPDVRQALAEVNASEYDIRGARSGYYPYAQLQNIQTNRDTTAGGGGSGTVARLTVPLFSGFSTEAELNTAQARQAIAQASLDLTRLNLGLRYGDAYFAALSAQTQSALLAQNVAVLRKLNQTITRRATEGAAPDADVKTAITRLRQAESQLTQARSQELTQRLALRSLANEDIGNLSWPGSARLEDGEVANVMDQAVARNPAILRAKAEQDVQEAQTRLSKSRLYPEIQLQYQKGMGGLADSSNYPEQTQLVVQIQTDNAYRGYESYRGAKERLVGSEARRESALRDVQQTVSTSRSQLELLRQQLRSQRLAVETAVQLVDSFLRQYNVGRKTWIEVLNAQREATDTQLQYATQLQSYWQTANRLALTAMYWDEWTSRTGISGVNDMMEFKP